MTLARFVFKHFLPVFIGAVLVLTFVAFMGQFIKIFNLAMVKGISPFWVAECFGFVLPNFLSFTLPVAFLVTLMLTLGQLAETGELLGLRAAGFSAFEILWPILAFALALSALLMWVNHNAGPSGWNAFKNRYAAAASKVASVAPEPKSFLNLGAWKLYAGEVDRRSGAMSDVHLFRYRGEAMSMTVAAKKGAFRLEPGRGMHLDLIDGELARPSAEDPERITRAMFQAYSIFVPFGVDIDLSRDPLPIELTTGQLKDRLRAAPPGRGTWEIISEKASRSANALSPLVFFWAAFPLGLRLEKRGRALGLAMSLGLLFFHYGFQILGLSLGRRGPLLAELAPWLGDAAYLAGGSWMIWRGKV